MQGDVITTGNIFKFQEEGMVDGRIQGSFVPGGDRMMRSHIVRFENAGIRVKRLLVR